MKTLALFASVLSLAIPLAAVGADPSPVGKWEDTEGQTRVQVSMCGDGSQLCAKLIGLAEEARTPENLELLNGLVVVEAEPLASNQWRGTVRFNGQTAQGSITLLGRDAIELSGCRLGICRSYLFNRL